MTRMRISATDRELMLLELLPTARAVLGTKLPDGGLHLVPVYFVHRRGSILVSAYLKSQKVRNLERDPTASLMIELGTAYAELRGALLRGRASILHLSPDEVAEVSAAVQSAVTGAAPDPVNRNRMDAQAPKRVVIDFRWDQVAAWDHRR